jgi:hypothetical protein
MKKFILVSKATEFGTYLIPTEIIQLVSTRHLSTTNKYVTDIALHNGRVITVLETPDEVNKLIHIKE